VNGQPARDRKELLYPYIRQGKNNQDAAANQVWHCPANERPDVEASYGFNTYLNEAVVNGVPVKGVRLNKIRRWSETVALCDGGLADQPTPGAPSLATHMWPPGRAATSSSCRPNHLRHPKQTICIGFVDGHGERMAMKPPFYPGIVGLWSGNGITDDKDPNYKHMLWDLK
jgi:hypothetical protein